MTERRRVVIDRACWARGGKGGVPGLLNIHGNMCCLGFYSKQILGAPDDELALRGMPSALYGEPGGYKDPAMPRWFGKWHLYRCGEEVMARINDCSTIDEAEREAWITEGFRALAGIDVEFIGEGFPACPV